MPANLLVVVALFSFGLVLFIGIGLIRASREGGLV
jgi:hypothetical protein